MPAVMRTVHTYILHACSDVYKARNILNNYGQLLENLFLPLFEVSLDPSSHPQLHTFLQQVRVTIAHGVLVSQSIALCVVHMHLPPLGEFTKGWKVCTTGPSQGSHQKINEEWYTSMNPVPLCG